MSVSLHPIHPIPFLALDFILTHSNQDSNSVLKKFDEFCWNSAPLESINSTQMDAHSTSIHASWMMSL